MRDKGIRPGGIDLPAWSASAALKFMDGHGNSDGRYLGDPGFAPLLDFLHRRAVAAIGLVMP